jgi:hypothetical protein
VAGGGGRCEWGPGDRIDGRVPNIVAGDKENPITHQRIERVIVQIEHGRQAPIPITDAISNGAIEHMGTDVGNSQVDEKS